MKKISEINNAPFSTDIPNRALINRRCMDCTYQSLYVELYSHLSLK